MSKKCSKCEKTKKLEEFAFQKDRNAYRSYCKECGRAMCRAYKARNKKHISEYNKEYKQEHKDEISVYNHDYHKENKEVIQKRHAKNWKKRKEKDENFYTTCKLRGKLNKFIKNSGTRYEQIMEKMLGCDWNAFAVYLSSFFDDDMTFENYGDYWSIDHVNPCCNFDLTDEENQYICFHWSNLRPMIKLHNNKKTGKTLDNEIKAHQKSVKYFLKYLPEEEKANYSQII